ncbi:MAG: sulfatase-like hydrolase/transferase [Phycisphaeraceae bacterium]|nr:sulfatase-like hydrolase/transferase [Phycisphaeraceae bacterium]
MPRPNILFLMVDQLQAGVLAEPTKPFCPTPHLDQLAARGLRLTRAYTPNPICSPARASLMTGLLPHNHGVLTVTHCVDPDQSVLRTDKPHWAQRLTAAGYDTAYFGKWHVERSGDLTRFGWQTNVHDGGQRWKDACAKRLGHPHLPGKGTLSPAGHITSPEGYTPSLLYGVTDEPAETRGIGFTTNLALDWLAQKPHAAADTPWCCFVSVSEPHDPFLAPRKFYDAIDQSSMPMPSSADDNLAGRPNLYRKAADIFRGLTDQQKRQARACYLASVTEIDEQFGRLIHAVEAMGQLDNTLILFTTDHGECLGAHGLYMKNVGAFEEIYNIPLILAGPGVAHGVTSGGRVGLHDLCPTLCDLAAVDPIHSADSRSFAPLLRDPLAHAADFTTGFAEYHGTRQLLTQRIVWDGSYKLVHNGFDFDELYNLADDPHELRNLANLPEHRPQLRRMMALAWQSMKRTGDHTLVNTGYPILRLAPIGPQAT